MLRRLRVRAARVPRAIIASVLVAFVSPAVAGPLVHCLEGTEGPRIIAATSHCPSMAESAPQASDPVHLATLDEAAGMGSGTGGGIASPALQSSGVLLHFGGLLPPILELRPPRDDSYGGPGPSGASTSGLAGAVLGRSVRLLI